MRAMTESMGLSKTLSHTQNDPHPLLSRMSSEDLVRSTSRLAPPGSNAPTPSSILVT